ncbi:hypothetical protein SAMN05518672_11393 [Chitinophaga sp. CF118]|uniref:hypothetical protein n=1 Tax=Chitinophaga sp. CF118 TaxID=1884367 RepID=UPI0008E398AD|nr:hypothetical protein [Chitinophaga sp. CF118]SFE97227.1 hypothetical protein SAMN05518672_11393 [Chitinophaga sp. CF118]
MRKMLLLSLAAVVFSCGSCSKDGATGPAGKDGTAGTDGKDGNANVIYSEWLDVEYDPIVGDFDEDGQVDDTGAYETVIPVEQLTKEVLTNGEVKVYINLGTADNPAIVPLPYVDLFAGYSINPTFYPQKIYLLATNSFMTYTDPEDNAKHQQYRYIIIPGGTAAARTTKTIDWNNYNEVKAYLKLKD